MVNDYSEIGFLALGVGNSWVLESKGWIWSEGMDPELLEALQALPEGILISVRHYSKDPVRQILITSLYRMSDSPQSNWIVGGYYIVTGAPTFASPHIGIPL